MTDDPGVETWWPAVTDAVEPPHLELSKPHTARVYDFLLGGKDHFAADREVGERLLSRQPEVPLGVREQRAVLRRAVRSMVADHGLRQLIDVGTGLPSADNVHEVAHAVAAETRVVYCDNDPVVLAHARALLQRDHQVRVAEADLARPETILQAAETRELVDLTEPVGLLLCGVLHYLPEAADPYGAVRRLVDALAPGSLVLVHHLRDAGDPVAAELQQEMQDSMGQGEFRTDARIAAFFDGLEILPPGLVHPTEWRPDSATPRIDEHPVLRLARVGMGRKG